MPTNATETHGSQDKPENISEYLTAREIEQIEADPTLTVDDVVSYRRENQ